MTNLSLNPPPQRRLLIAYFRVSVARQLEKMMSLDSSVGTLSDKLSAGGGLGVGGLSGLQDRDYPAAAATGSDAAALKLTTK